MNKAILINCIAIQDSGGITVLDKMLEECQMNNNYIFYIFVTNHINIINLISKFENISAFNFIKMDNKGIIHRLYYENFYFKNFINENNISLIYNFSGSSQFNLKIPSLVKVQNLMFYSEKLDLQYKSTKHKKLWLKQIFLKRLIFLTMLKQSHSIEVQAKHVISNLKKFIDISDKTFFIKNDFPARDIDFIAPKHYDFKKKPTFLYIVGPHFDVINKNINDFIFAMIKLKDLNVDFKIKITLTYKQLNSYSNWDESLNNYTEFMGYQSDKHEIKNLFSTNTILISTSVIETLGLHVIEGIENGIVCITPNEAYSNDVYGNYIPKYDLFKPDSLLEIILKILSMNQNTVHSLIENSQKFMIKNESLKHNNILEIFNILLTKEKVNV